VVGGIQKKTKMDRIIQEVNQIIKKVEPQDNLKEVEQQLIHLKGLIRQKEEAHQVQINQLKVEINRLAHL
jgi:hypothetical protein